MPHESSLFKRTFTFFGAMIGAVRGAEIGARTSARVADAIAREESTPAANASQEIAFRPYKPEMHFPARPGPDWHDPLPARLPKPTYAPASLAMGICLAAAGVVTHFWVSLAGLILFLLGLTHWIGELLHERK